MSKVHGKGIFVSVGGVDLSKFSNNTQFPREADVHDTTTYGNDAHRYNGGLLDGTFVLQGFYDNDVAGPAVTLEPMLGTTVEVIYQPEGAGTGRPTRTFDVVVGKYDETAPVANMITWQCDMTIDGDVVKSVQV